MPAEGQPSAPAPQQPAPPLAAPSTATPSTVVPKTATPPIPAASPAAPAAATAESVEAEIARSENAELQTLLKTNFGEDYGTMIATLVKRRNEGATAEQSSQDLEDRLQDLMRAKLKFAVGASSATIDRLAANEANLFHALGTDSAPFCLKLLGKDDKPAGQPPDNVREMMRLGTLYRFQAIVEGMPDVKPVAALTPEDMKAFEASVESEGLQFEDVRSGAFMTKAGNQSGTPCLMLEKLYRAIARLPEDTRRKIYAGMFFLGRDK
jgi:hypothetical protein